MLKTPDGWELVYVDNRPVLIDEHGIRWVPMEAKPPGPRDSNTPGYPFCDQWSCPPHLPSCYKNDT